MQITADQERAMRRLLAFVLEENKKVNLTAFRTQETCWIGNILDSLEALTVLEKYADRIHEQTHTRTNVIDVGTGGGFPLLPLAICLPSSSWTGIDATGKKIDAIKRMVQKLRLRNVHAEQGRAEKLGHDPQHRERYDVVLSRAVAPLNTLLEFCNPFARIGGHIVLWKSLQIDAELRDSLLVRAELSCHLVHQHRYALPAPYGERQLLVFQKTAALARKYPRGVGVPKKNPLRYMENGET